MTALSSPRRSAAFVGLLSLLLTGCSPAFSNKPLGQRPAKLDADKLDGIWVAAGGSVLNVMVTEADAGKARLASIEKEGKEFKLNQMEVEVRESGNQMFLNLLEPAEGERKARYSLMRMALRDNQIILWRPKFDELKKAVEANKLAAQVDAKEKEILIQSDYEKAASFLASPEATTLFDYTEPMVLMRLKLE
jgi:hypothetical protein